MSNLNDTQQCLGAATSLQTNTELMKINLCQPIRNICDGTSEILFFANDIPEVNGIFTVTNSSSNCTILLSVLDRNGFIVYALSPQDSFTAGTNELIDISYTCTGPDPTAFCTGSFEANLYYCVDC
ncbi:hypothetical protein CAI16_07265 [Virgibacillus dokdonensis]|uniref:Endospore appendages core domain-containing protein n=1 Tax=Virgibacillus dokdonensis TaxID=302167 RepID=A0A3E0WS94_9BACI|nr:S-Ena type endospore appendage [Virgibacillus dokdonensis]RFA35842.1 hypothetical protein CAI16_07265 [Virgibacillus dokdonensis]